MRDIRPTQGLTENGYKMQNTQDTTYYFTSPTQNLYYYPRLNKGDIRIMNLFNKLNK